MHSDAFDRYHHGHSPIHSLDPRVKVLVTLAFIISNALLPDGAWIAFALAWLFILVANIFSQLGIGFTFRRSFIALPFALAAITVLFSIPGQPVSSFHFFDVELYHHRRRTFALCKYCCPLVAFRTDGDSAGGNH